MRVVVTIRYIVSRYSVQSSLGSKTFITLIPSLSYPLDVGVDVNSLEKKPKLEHQELTYLNLIGVSNEVLDGSNDRSVPGRTKLIDSLNLFYYL